MLVLRRAGRRTRDGAAELCVGQLREDAARALSPMRRPSYARWNCKALRRELRGNVIHACSRTRGPSRAR
eukprot:4320986-Alexandrium_andersonii.AAC.1